jgi:hypothetical protein
MRARAIVVLGGCIPRPVVTVSHAAPGSKRPAYAV